MPQSLRELSNQRNILKHQHLACRIIELFIVSSAIIGIAWILCAVNIIRVTPKPIVTIAQAQEIKSDEWQGYALLKKIASCESWGSPDKEPRQFGDDGKVLRGFPNPRDIGLGQINLDAWQKQAGILGFNLFTYEGNLKMSKWIFDHLGSKPWKFSKNCWS